MSGISRQGESVTLHWNGQFQRSEIERVRREIERRSGLVFSEKIIWWRLIAVIVTLGLGFLLIAALLIGVMNQ